MPPDFGVGSPFGAGSRADLIAAERARRQAMRDRRHQRGDEAAAEAMAAGERNQRTALARVLSGHLRALLARIEREERLRGRAVAVDDALESAGASDDVRASWRGTTWSGLRERVRADGSSSARVLLALAHSGVAELAVGRVEQLRAGLSGDLSLPTEPPSAAWRVARGLATVVEGGRPEREDLRAMVRCGHPGIVDTALDLDPSLAPAARGAAESRDELDYLTARSNPRALDAAALGRLGWDDEVRRRAFVAGERPVGDPDHDPWCLRRRLLDGDLGALPATREVLPGLRDVADDFASLSAEQLVARYGDDHSLWRLLDAVVGDAPGPLGSAPLDAWRTLHRARIALYDDDLAGAVAYLRAVRSAEFRGAGIAEYHNLALYCAVMRREVSTAHAHLKALQKHAHSPVTRDNLDTARAALRRLQDGDHRTALDRFESPWVVLGLDEPPDAGPAGRAWDARWIQLQRLTRSDAPRRIRVNQARQRLVAGANAEPHFVVPLVATPYEPALRGRLVPREAVLPRQTPRPGPDVVQTWRARALSLVTSSALDEAQPTELWQELHEADL